MKYLLLLLVLVVAVGALWLGRRKAERAATPPKKPEAAPKPDALQSFVACSHCRLNVPQAEALFDVAGRPFCSAEHLRIGPRT